MSFAWLEVLLDRLLREPCTHCGASTQVPGALCCDECTAQCRLTPARLVDGVPAISAVWFDGPIREVLHRFKYSGQPELARRLAGSLLRREELRALVAKGRVAFVPVPIHRERLVSRGYNQAALLATRLARGTRSQVWVRALERRSNTQQQVKLSRLERDANLRDQIVARASMRGRVVLVDDVLTTGATARACFAAIRAAGAEPVAVVTVAAAE